MNSVIDMTVPPTLHFTLANKKSTLIEYGKKAV